MTRHLDGPAGLTEALVAGPRGRRLLMEFARRSEQVHGVDQEKRSFHLASFHAAYDLDPGKGRSVVMYVVGADVEDGSAPDFGPAPTPAECGDRLEGVHLAEPTEQLLVWCLADAAEAARYWQEHDGADVLGAQPEMQAGLRRVAEHLAGAPANAWWGTGIDLGAQWAVSWVDRPTDGPRPPTSEVLREAQKRNTENERRARRKWRKRPRDPRADVSGEWWSDPPFGVPSSTRELSDGSPVGLWVVEDSMGWERARTTRLSPLGSPRVYEIDTASAWADLCARFPATVTAEKRHDWFRTTGRDGTWVVPDWVEVAEHYDAVHLQVSTYLSAAGTSIEVDHDSASVIAGWAPDETFWLSDAVHSAGASREWAGEDRGAEFRWWRADSAG